ncbi:hypothetical protein TNCV_2094741 [Trichonephila clavipes]|nr:hypothetical protein TNCV_2094741 [Trichonephila clavipes]
MWGPCMMVHKSHFRFRCVTTSILHITRTRLDTDNPLLGFHVPGPQSFAFLPLEPPGIVCALKADGFSGESRCVDRRRFS